MTSSILPLSVVCDRLQLALDLVEPHLDAMDDLEWLDGRQDLDSSSDAPLRNVIATITMRKQNDFGLERIRRMGRDQSGPSQTKRSESIGRATRMLNGLVEDHLGSVLAPLVGAEGDKISGLNKEQLLGLAPANLGARR